MALGWIAWDQLDAYGAYRRLDELAMTETARPEDLRLTAHQALGFWLGDPHDAFLTLDRYGDASSVPFLRKALAQRPTGDAVACTSWHGQKALDRILGLARSR
jgi:hypothetical protein